MGPLIPPIPILRINHLEIKIQEHPWKDESCVCEEAPIIENQFLQECRNRSNNGMRATTHPADDKALEITDVGTSVVSYPPNWNLRICHTSEQCWAAPPGEFTLPSIHFQRSGPGIDRLQLRRHDCQARAFGQQRPRGDTSESMIEVNSLRISSFLRCLTPADHDLIPDSPNATKPRIAKQQ